MNPSLLLCHNFVLLFTRFHTTKETRTLNTRGITLSSHTLETLTYITEGKELEIYPANLLPSPPLYTHKHR